MRRLLTLAVALALASLAGPALAQVPDQNDTQTVEAQVIDGLTCDFAALPDVVSFGLLQTGVHTVPGGDVACSGDLAWSATATATGDAPDDNMRLFDGDTPLLALLTQPLELSGDPVFAPVTSTPINVGTRFAGDTTPIVLTYRQEILATDQRTRSGQTYRKQVGITVAASL